MSDSEAGDSHSTAIVVVSAVLANGSAWVQSLAMQNVNIGAVAAFCSIAVPAMVGAVVYSVQKVGPVVLDFLARLDAAKSVSLGGQMARLNRNLEDAIEREASTRKVADAANSLADQLRLINDLSEKRNAEKLLTIAKQTAIIDDQSRTIASLTAHMAEIKVQLSAQDDAIEVVRKDVNSNTAAATAAALAAAKELADSVRQKAEAEIAALHAKLEAMAAPTVANPFPVTIVPSPEAPL